MDSNYHSAMNLFVEKSVEAGIDAKIEKIDTAKKNAYAEIYGDELAEEMATYGVLARCNIDGLAGVIRIYNLETIIANQEAYKTPDDDKKLIADRDPDPIYIDRDGRVLSATHGKKGWCFKEVSKSLPCFYRELAIYIDFYYLRVNKKVYNSDWEFVPKKRKLFFSMLQSEVSEPEAENFFNFIHY